MQIPATAKIEITLKYMSPQINSAYPRRIKIEKKSKIPVLRDKSRRDVFFAL
jgi:hypothetical protein